MFINGKEHPDLNIGSVTEVLTSLSLNVSKVVVEVNGDIIPKSKYDTYQIDEAAKVEIVSFVGGG